MGDKREMFQIFARRFGFLNKNCCDVGGIEISLIQSHILYEIDKHKNPSMAEIANELGVDITTFSRQIKSLEKEGLLTRTPSVQDKRIYILKLTTQGNFIAGSIAEQMNQYLEDVFSHMSSYEKEMVLNSIELLNNAMKKTDVCCKPMI